MLFGVLALVSIPTIIAVTGAQEWALLATLQSVGVFASVVVAYGWNISGPRYAAGTQSQNVVTLVVDSLKIRALIFAFLSLVAFATLMVLGSAAIWIHWVAFVSTAAIGLRVGWVFIGRNLAGYNFLVDAVPRLTCITGGIAIGIVFHNVIWVFLGPIIGIALSVLAGYMVAHHWASGYSRLPGKTFAELFRKNAHELVTSLAGGAYVAAPIVLVSQVSPGSLPVFALIDRIWKQANTGFSPIFDYLHSITGPRTNGGRKAARRAMAIASIVTTSGALVFLAIHKPLVNWIGHGQIVVSVPVATLFGALFIVNNTSLVMTEISLSAAGLLKNATWLLALTAVLGLSACGYLVQENGPIGALSGLIVGFAINLAFGFILLFRPYRRTPRHRMESRRT